LTEQKYSHCIGHGNLQKKSNSMRLEIPIIITLMCLLGIIVTMLVMQALIDKEDQRDWTKVVIAVWAAVEILALAINWTKIMNGN